MIDNCPARAKSMMPSAIGLSIWRGELVLMTVVHQAPPENSSSDSPLARRTISKLSPICLRPRA